MESTTIYDLNFSYNWNNKLFNKAFTSIRLYNPTKYVINNLFKVNLKGNYLFTAKLLEVKIIYPKNITNWLAYLDIGYNAEEVINILSKIYKNNNDILNTKFHYLLFIRLEESEVNQ
jgi:hypothetical protein